MTQKPLAPSELADKFVLRMPDGMRERIKEAAAKNNRSMNSEIVERLEQSFRGKDALSEDEVSQIIQRTIAALSDFYRPQIDGLHEEIEKLKGGTRTKKSA